MSHRKSSPRLTAEISAKIKSLLQYTALNHAQIAAMLGGINQGRISEVKTGKRFSGVISCSLEEALCGNRGYYGPIT